MTRTESIRLRAAKFWNAHPCLDNRIMEAAFDRMHHGLKFRVEDIAAVISASKVFTNGLTAEQLARHYDSTGW